MEEIKKYIAEYADYLEDIRKKLYRLIIFFITAFCVGFFLAAPFLKYLLNLLRMKDVVITTTSPFQIVDLAMNIGLFFAVIVTLPLVIYNIYSFLQSGLLTKEKKIFFILLPVGFVLFFVGFFYGLTTFYYALKLVAGIDVSLGVANLWDINHFISQMIFMSTLLGIIFQFPIILTFLIRLGAVKTDYLRRKRKIAVAVIFIFVGFLPPPDILSTFLQALPLVLLYELTIWINSAVPVKNRVLAEVSRVVDYIES